MPDKQHDSKFMEMLERKGIVRKVGSDDERDVAEQDSAIKRSAPTYATATVDELRTMSAPRQPVPGMLNPVMHGGIPLRDNQPVGQRMTPQVEKPLSQVGASSAINTEQKRWASMSSAGSISDDFDTFSEAVPWNDEIEELDNSALNSVDRLERGEIPSGDLTDGYHDIDELYDALSLKSVRKDNIFLIEEYLKTLPESLPEESRRDIVAKIVVASGFDNDMLMGDGVLRVKMLKEYAERFARCTDEYVAARQAELDELEQQTLRVRKLIETRRELHKKQFFTIEAEAQRLKDILTFITG